MKITIQGSQKSKERKVTAGELVCLNLLHPHRFDPKNFQAVIRRVVESSGEGVRWFHKVGNMECNYSYLTRFLSDKEGKWVRLDLASQLYKAVILSVDCAVKEHNSIMDFLIEDAQQTGEVALLEWEAFNLIRFPNRLPLLVADLSQKVKAKKGDRPKVSEKYYRGYVDLYELLDEKIGLEDRRAFSFFNLVLSGRTINMNYWQIFEKALIEVGTEYGLSADDKKYQSAKYSKPDRKVISPADVKNAYLRYSNGEQLNDIASSFNVHPRTIKRKFIKAGLLPEGTSC